ncbi:MAG: hypothetical protein ACTSUE_07030 [Promethearchaeota archaeon]
MGKYGHSPSWSIEGPVGKRDRQVVPVEADRSRADSSNKTDTRAETSCRFPVIPHTCTRKYGDRFPSCRYAPACRCGKNTRYRLG